MQRERASKPARVGEKTKEPKGVAAPAKGGIEQRRLWVAEGEGGNTR